MNSCDDCGVTSRSAYIVETDETTLSGSYRCRECQRKKRGEKRTRDAGQEGLGRWAQ